MKVLLLSIVSGLTVTLTASAARFSIPDAGVSFDAPEGFTQLTQQEILSKYPSGRAPAFVVGDERRTTTIAYDVKPDSLPPDKLVEAKASFEQLFERIIPGLDGKKERSSITSTGNGFTWR